MTNELDDGSTESTNQIPLTESPTPSSRSEPTLDRSALDANLAKLSASERELVDRYLHPAEGNFIVEGTVIVAAPISVDEAVTRLFGADPSPSTKADRKARRDGIGSSYAVVQVGDGVVAFEDTGFADPPRRLLAALSQDGVTSAVATENIEAMARFGYARDGTVVFDNAEYAFVDELEQIPAEVRDLAALAWDDLDGPVVATADWFSVALAMSEKVTGLRVDPIVQDAPSRFPVPLPWG